MLITAANVGFMLSFKHLYVIYLSHSWLI